jgi:hypothetical protein
MINKIILIISALSVVGCHSNNDYQHPIVVPPPPNVSPPNKVPSFIPTPQPTFIPPLPYQVARRKQESERKVLTFIVE